ncbi:Flavin-binding monooxygenase family protein [Hibiscus syriacus]|uniref:Flavin-binding monooxygenase family protein n=1 Tax=Hibiscus syriacus TaxID=106335 RepID=A0A6A2Y1R1_HIBSY|nr:uncharacterized protein LOC120187203 [Hibiscus syriacus]XP_039046911.1 uncharacterized protein LOC120187203 [Hibiscus syriacus]KAE8661754.1 Flavin-binding monooxygenase family protein [Hibiscus syriacus]
MATLQMQANVQHESPFPRWYTTWDLNSDANGTVCPSDNVNRISRIRQYTDVTLLLSLGSNMFYNKGLLKQTMLKHEAEFRDQIRELHRLYRKQKELMDEMKTIDFFKHGCNVEMFQPNHVLRPKSSNHVRVPQQTGSVFPEISEAEGSGFPSHSYDGSKEEAGLDPTHTESSSRAYVLTESNCKKLGRRFLDLELPADGYFDSEEDGFQEVTLDPAVTNIPSNALKKINVGDRGDNELPHSGIVCTSIFPKENFVTCSASSKLKVIADLNAPVELEEDIIPEFSSRQKLLHIEHKMQRECVPSNDKAGQDGNDLNAFPRDLYTRKLSIQHINNERAQDCAILHGFNETDAKLCIGNFWHVTSDVSSSYYEPTSGSPWRCAFKRSPIAVQALPCFKGESPKSFIISPELDFVSPNFPTNVTGSQDASHTPGENTVQNPTGCTPRIAEIPVPDNRSGEMRDPLIPPDSAVGSLCVHDAELEKMEATDPLEFESMLGIEGNKVKEINRIPNINMEFNPMPEREKEAQIESVAESEAWSKYQGCRIIDLNSCLSMDESLLLPSHSTKVDLEPPVSLENKECLPPRGKSNENQLETTLLFSGQEDTDLQAELARNAAEALVCISSSQIQTCLEKINCQLFRASTSLYWFARVASSVSDDPGSELGVNIGVKDYGDQEEYQSDGIDYFEAMTLNLTEINAEETWCASNVQKEPESSAIHSAIQSNRGRKRRGRHQEAFQSELLPSHCFSRYKVAKDLHLIGGLVKAGDAHHESSSSRNAGKSGCRKGRRRYNLITSREMDSTTNTMLKRQSGNGKFGIRIKG